MVTLVYGGSGSGKSELAESLVVASSNRNRLYIATMAVWDEEGRRRVERHRRLRAGKGFSTLERTHDLLHAELPEGSIALLEDLTNLFMGEWYGVGKEGAIERTMEGISYLADRAEDVILVGNDLFSDGIFYGEEMEEYLTALAALHRQLAAKADTVIEVVCGLPIIHKGENPL